MISSKAIAKTKMAIKKIELNEALIKKHGKYYQLYTGAVTLE